MVDKGENQTVKMAALIVAGGTGSRAGGDLPKQYAMLAGQTILRRTVSKFLNNKNINQVQVVIHPETEALYKQAVGDLDLLPPAYGGTTRQESVRLGLETLAKYQPTHVLIHDAARPFVSVELIESVIQALKQHQAVIPAVSVADTVKVVRDGKVTQTLERNELVHVQTPQGFAFPLIRDLHAQYKGQQLTDDASLAEAAEIEVAVVAGDPRNYKLTTAMDMAQAQRQITYQETRVGSGFDVHKFVAFDDSVSPQKRQIMLCGVAVESPFALEGHSDADVGLHSLTDAILGTIGEGDIGLHFPPTDQQWKGAPSDRFLAHAAKLVAARGGKLVHLDVTLICETPKVSPHREAMRAQIASILNIDVGRVSVKATTTEKLGFTGRKEGVAAQAIATVSLPSAEE